MATGRQSTINLVLFIRRGSCTRGGNAIRRVVAGRDPPKSLRTKIAAANFERRHGPDIGYTALSGATDYALFNCPTCGVAVV